MHFGIGGRVEGLTGMTAEWNTAIGGLVAALDTDAFAGALVAALRSLADFDYSVAFAYRGEARPIDLFDDFPTGKRRVMVDIYQDGPYLLDPLYLACARRVQPDLYRLRSLAPDRFFQGEYFRSYYAQTGLSEEIGYIVELPGSVMVVVSLMRSSRHPAFSAKEFRQLRDAYPVVSSFVARHWKDLQERFEATPGAGLSIIQSTIDSAFSSFGKSVLTRRERDVVEYVLKGHSSAAIGHILGIAPGTVRIHRKNIYTKLGINSQGELFAQFIHSLSELRAV